MNNKIHKYNGALECFAIWKGVLCDEDIEQIKKIEELQTFQAGTTGTQLKKEIRDSDVSFITRDQHSEWLYNKISSMIGTVNRDHFLYNVDGFQPIQYTKYKLDQHYTWHWDVHFGYETDQRKISMVTVLNDPDDYEGGEFEICTNGNIANPRSFKPEKGDAVFFASWMPHRVKSVTKGERNSLVVWATGPRET